MANSAERRELPANAAKLSASDAAGEGLFAWPGGDPCKIRRLELAYRDASGFLSNGGYDLLRGDTG